MFLLHWIHLNVLMSFKQKHIAYAEWRSVCLKQISHFGKLLTVICWLLGSPDLCLWMRVSVSSAESHPNLSIRERSLRKLGSLRVLKLNKAHCWAPLIWLFLRQQPPICQIKSLFMVLWKCKAWCMSNLR